MQSVIASHKLHSYAGRQISRRGWQLARGPQIVHPKFRVYVVRCSNI